MPKSIDRWSHTLYLALVALLPLHTVSLRAEIAWKPWLVLLILVVVLDVVSARALPGPRRLLLAAGVFLVAVMVSWPGPDAGATFWRLWLALAAGVLLLLSSTRPDRGLNTVLPVVFWSGAAMGATAFVLALVTNGVFGEEAVSAVNEWVLVDRVNKPAYLSTGFIALTNWHQDPGYAALWSNVWLILGAAAWSKGLVRGPRWLGPLVLGSLVMSTILTFSRTGWVGLLLALGVVGALHIRSPEYNLRRGIRLVAMSAVVGTVLVGVLAATDPQDVGGDIGTALEFRVLYLAELGSIDTGEVGVVDPDLVVPDNRLEVWSEYWDRFLTSPIRGIGLGTGWSEEGLQEPHSMWLELLAETGIIGLAGFGFLIATLGWSPSREVIAVLAVLGFATLTQTVLFEPVLWFTLGLWAVSVEESKETPLTYSTSPR